MNLSGKVVIVTGASMGIGEAAAYAFAKEGARVVLAARSAEKLSAVAEKIQNTSGEALVVSTDVAQRDQVEAMVKTVLEKWQQIDVLVNNAGYGMQSPAIATPEDELRKLFDVNVFGCLYCIQAVYPHMKKRKQGQIINVSSIVSLRAIPTITGYCMSKYALNGLTDGLTPEARLDGIDVLTVHPAHTLTNFHDNQHVVGEKLEHPKWFAQSPQAVAKAIVRASKKRRRDTIMTLSARMMRHFNHFFPRTMDRILSAGFKKFYE